MTDCLKAFNKDCLNAFNKDIQHVGFWAEGTGMSMFLHFPSVSFLLLTAHFSRDRLNTCSHAHLAKHSSQA